MKNTLFLASKSRSRRTLLEEAKIPFVTIDQDAEEMWCDWNLPLRTIVERLAVHKMKHAVVPPGVEGQHCHVVTADTLSVNADGTIHGKPVDRDDAIAKIKAARQGSSVGTAFCLDLKVWHDGSWHMCKRVERYVKADYLFVVPDEWIDTYLENSLSYTSSGAIAIEGYGAQFLRTIAGSHSTIVGLPMFELREALVELGFFDDSLSARPFSS